MSHAAELQEFTRITKAREIDEDKGILYDLVALGPESLNGRDYPEATQRKLLPLIEGRQSFANHTKGTEPSVYDVLGVWQKPYVKDGMTYGNFHYFKTHRLAPTLVEAARRPELNKALGFSINARGRVRHEKGRQIVEDFDELKSIDCVAQAATVKGLYESRAATVRELCDALRESRPEYARALSEAAQAGVMDYGASMPQPGAPGAGGDYVQGLLDAAKTAMDGAADDLDRVHQVIGAIFKLIKKLKAGNGDKGGDVDTKPTEESVQDAAELAQFRAEKRLRKAAKEAGVEVADALCECVRPDLTDEQMAALVESFRPRPPAQTPRSAPPPAPQKGKDGKPLREGVEGPPEGATAKELARWVNGR